jgi:hypothetical protein
LSVSSLRPNPSMIIDLRSERHTERARQIVGVRMYVLVMSESGIADLAHVPPGPATEVALPPHPIPKTPTTLRPSRGVATFHG